MFIAFTNLQKLMSLNYRVSELKQVDNRKVLSNDVDNHEFLILFPDGNWLASKKLPENFTQAVAIFSFDYDEEDKIPEDLTKLLESQYKPYCLVLYHSNQNNQIDKLLKNQDYSYKGVHRKEKKEYKIVIDLLLDAPKEEISNAQFVHEKIKELKADFFESAFLMMHTKLIRHAPPSKLPQIFSAFDTEYQIFLKKINGQFDENNSRHRKLLDELKTLLQEDEYRA